MAKIAKLIGGAGTGKTTELLRIMAQLLDRWGDSALEQIGFVSFTRAARREAATRAAKQFGGEPDQLEKHGWFRTLHSVCYRCTAEDRTEKLLTDNAESRRWIQGHCGGEAEWAGESDLAFASAINRDDVVQTALALWDFSRHRLVPLKDAYQRLVDAGPDLLHFTLDEILDVVRKYESAKWQEDRIDFTDLMLRFTGVRADVGGLHELEPQGYVPCLPVWFLDEWQDSSPLMNRVARRLIEAPSVEYVYVAGDPYQAIYSFTGSDPRYLRDMAADKTRIMPQSFRCPPVVHAYGEQILQQSSDYWDRNIKPAAHAGAIHQTSVDLALEMLASGESWLVLTRTNQQARDLATRIQKAGLVWKPTRGVGGWEAPKKRVAMFALADMARDNAPITGEEWNTILDYLPVNDPKTKQPLLARGTKAKWLDQAYRAERRLELARAQRAQEAEPDISDWGATPFLQHAIRTGRWPELLNQSAADARDWDQAIRTLPYEAVANPSIRVGTIHSVKGEEADNVLVCTSWCRPAREAAENDMEARDEEIRLAYVAATRARQRLVIADRYQDGKIGNRMPFPAVDTPARLNCCDAQSIIPA